MVIHFDSIAANASKRDGGLTMAEYSGRRLQPWRSAQGQGSKVVGASDSGVARRRGMQPRRGGARFMLLAALLCPGMATDVPANGTTYSAQEGYWAE